VVANGNDAQTLDGEIKGWNSPLPEVERWAISEPPSRKLRRWPLKKSMTPVVSTVADKNYKIGSGHSKMWLQDGPPRREIPETDRFRTASTLSLVGLEDFGKP